MNTIQELITKLEEVGKDINHKFGTESYEIRCRLYDIRKELESKFFVLKDENKNES